MILQSCSVACLGSELAVGALKSASAMYMFLPGVWWMVNWNRIRRSLNLSTLGGKLSSILVLRSGNRGLWSVSTENCFPNKYPENFSYAHVIARASFLICA